MARSVRESSTLPFFAPLSPTAVRAGRGWFLALGIGLLALGLLDIALPFVASLVTTMVIGWLMVVGGALHGYHAVRHHAPGSGWAMAAAVVEVIAGIAVIAFPVAGTLTLTLVLAGFFLAEGGIKIVRALQHRALPYWGWLLFDGAVAVGLGLLILLGWPGTAIWALGLLVGINFVFSGMSALLIWAVAKPPATIGH